MTSVSSVASASCIGRGSYAKSVLFGVHFGVFLNRTELVHRRVLPGPHPTRVIRAALLLSLQVFRVGLQGSQFALMEFA